MEPVLPKQIGTEEGRLLFEKSKEIKDFKEGKEIIKILKKTLDHYSGVGLAAPQIGTGKRAFIINIEPTPRYPQAPEIGFRAYLNPRILELSSELNPGLEGCLSVFYGSLYGKVERAPRLKIEYFDREGNRKVEEIEDPFQARVIQHEYDHLNGKIFLQRMKSPDFAELIWDRKKDIRQK